MADAKVSLQIETSQANREVSALEKELEELADAGGEAGRQLDILDDKLAEVGKEAKDTDRAVDNAGRAIENTGRKTENASRKTDRNTRETRENTRAVDKQGKEVAETTRDIERNTRATNKNTNAKQSNTAATTVANKAQTGAATSAMALGAGIGAATAATSKFLGPIGVAAGAVYGITAAFNAAVAPFERYEKEMSAVQAVTNATAMDMMALEKVARQVGATTAYSASQVAGAQVFLGMAGMTSEEIVGATRATTLLAGGTRTDLSSAADIMTNIMDPFNISAKESIRVADVLGKTVTSANTTVLELGEAMKYAGGTADAFGLDLETVAAMLGVAAGGGIKGSMAGTGIARAIASLAKVTDETAVALARFGLTAEEVNPATNEFLDIIERLSDAQLDFVTAQKLFGDRGVRPMLAILKDNEKLEKFVENLKNANGEIERLYELSQENLAGDRAKRDSAWESLLLSLGLGDVARDRTQARTAQIKWLEDLVTGGRNPTEVALLKLDQTIANQESTIKRRNEIQAQMNNPGWLARLFGNVPGDSEINAYRAETDIIKDELAENLLMRRKLRGGGEPVSLLKPDTTSSLLISETEPEPVEGDFLKLDKVVVEAVDSAKELDKFYRTIGTSTEEFGQILDSGFNSMFKDILDGQREFGDIFDETMKNIFENVLSDMWANKVANPLSNWLSKSLIPTIFRVPGFAGGGYTGSGPRSGGLDGMGGYLAMVHPNETIVDNKRGNSSGMQINLNVVPSETGQTEVSATPNNTGGTDIKLVVAGVIADDARRNGPIKQVINEISNSRTTRYG